jgi:cytoskeletal protein CcmA (bactofilin family)
MPLSLIGADVRIVGNIISEGEIQIDGKVEGDITCQRLIVGEGGHIVGEVTAERAQVHGRLEGKIDATSVTIARSARVVGDVTHESLEIEAGGFLEGRCCHKVKPPAGSAEAVIALPAQHKGNGAGQPAQLAPPQSAAATA